jgi:DNA-binding MarR family transcriptional regulator
MTRTLEPSPKAVDGEVDDRIFFRLFQIGNTLQRRALKELGVSTVQVAVLGALSRTQPTDGVSLSELSKYLVVSRQNLDGVVKRLERTYHVCRVPGLIDKRARMVRLTTEGTQFWSALQPQIHGFYERALQSFSLDERIALAHHLKRLQISLSAATSVASRRS